ncbi:MAG TPA: hypothetical protein V6C58_09240 [Allocoleopsis sp.]
MNNKKEEIHAILFEKDLYTLKTAKEWLKTHNHKPISHRYTKNLIRFRIIEPNYNKYIYRSKNIGKGIIFVFQINK